MSSILEIELHLQPADPVAITVHPHMDEAAQPDAEPRANRRIDPPVTAAEAVLVDVSETPSESGGSKPSAHIEDHLDKELEEMVAQAASPKHTSTAVSYYNALWRSDSC